MSPEQIQGWLQIGLGGAMLVALFFGYRKIWVFGWIYEVKAKEAEDWKAIAQVALGQNADLIETAKAHTSLSPEQAEMALRIIREAGSARAG